MSSSTELALRLTVDNGARVLDSVSGEYVLVADASLVELVDLRAQLMALDSQVESAKAAIDQRLTQLIDARNLQPDPPGDTLHLDGGYTLKLVMEMRVDGDQLRQDLLAHAAELDVTPEKIESLFHRKVTYSRYGKLSEWNALAKLRPAITAYLQQHTTLRGRRVTLTHQPPPRVAQPAAIDSTAIEDPNW